MIVSYRDVSVQKLLEKTNPLNGDLWGCRAITVHEIQTAICCKPSEVTPYNDIKDSATPKGGWRNYHIQRIATLALDEIDDSTKEWSIAIAVFLNPETVDIPEGRHRVCAAFVRGETTLSVKVYEGENGDYDVIFGGNN